MHGFDTFTPQFAMQIQGTRIVVTPNLVFEILHIPWVVHPDYPACPRLRILSKDELLYLFCEISSSWGERQSTLCSSFAKVLRFLNMVMSFVLHPLSHYNSITELCTRFLLSLIEDLSIDFPSHLILSFIDVYRDTTTRDKLIFPSAITQILHHLSIPYLQSSDFTVISAISICSIKRGLASTEAATNRDGDSSSPFYSIHLCSFFFEWWCDA